MSRKYSWQDTTEETAASLQAIQLEDLQDRTTWRSLATLVLLRPDGDVLPFRTRYSPDKDTLTIGLNEVRSDQPLWYTLADVIASKILTGRAPVIERAITFSPDLQQADLRALNLLGEAQRGA